MQTTVKTWYGFKISRHYHFHNFITKVFPSNSLGIVFSTTVAFILLSMFSSSYNGKQAYIINVQVQKITSFHIF